MVSAHADAASYLAETLNLSREVCHVALENNDGDINAAAASLLATMPEEPADPSLKKLLDMGFPEAEAQQALLCAQGNVEEAALGLLSVKDPVSAPVAAGAHGPTRSSADATGRFNPSTSLPPDVELGDCAICCESLSPSDAAMRCSGQGGSYHYGHAKCLAEWIQRCRANSTTPTCPTCRGPLQMNRRRLNDFMQQRDSASAAAPSRGRRRMSAEDSEVLHGMLRQPAERGGNDNEWEEIKVEDILMGVAVVAGTVALGLAAKGLIDHFSKRRERD